MVEIEMGKTYRTRDERDYRLYATDAGGPYPVHGAVLDPCNGRWIHTTHALDGCYERNRPNHPSDLIEVEPTRTLEGWVNVYPRERRFCHVWYDKADADAHANSDRVACVRIETRYAEGEGLRDR